MRRRSFLKSSAAAVAATGLPNSALKTSRKSKIVDFNFVLEPEFLARLDYQTQTLSHISPVIVDREMEQYLPTILSEYIPDESEAVRWLNQRNQLDVSAKADRLPNSNPLDMKANLRLYGEPFIADVVSHIQSQSQSPSDSVDQVALNIFTTTTEGSAIGWKVDDLGIRLIGEQGGVIGGRGDILPQSHGAGRHLFGSPVVRIYYKYPDTHPLVPCVNQPVYHVGFEIFTFPQWDWRTGSWSKGGTKISNLHAGSYTSSGRKCWVIYDNLHQWICLKDCNAIRGFQAIYNAVHSKVFAALVGIGIASWIAYTIATVIAGLVAASPVLVL